MPTKFEEIYNRAIFKFTDYTFLTSQADCKTTALQKYLQSAVVDFEHVSKVNLAYDTELKEFYEKLGNEECEILALGVAYYWLSAQLLNRELLKNRIHNSDYNSYSPANLLKEIRSLKDDVEQQFYGKINTYSFYHSQIEDRKV